jgi:hypothetical protein
MRSRYQVASLGNVPSWRVGLGRGLRTALGCALTLVLAGLLLDLSAVPAHAQFPFFGNTYRQAPPRPRQGIPQRPQQYQQPVRRAPPFGFPFFGGGRTYSYPSYQGYPNDADEIRRRQQQQQQQRVDSSRAPAHRRPETEPPKHVLVLGDSMADWLSYGLEEAFFEANELGVTRKHRTGSSLIRNETREYDWVQGARDLMTTERADFVVMMIGLNDRHAIRERPGEAQREGADTSQPNIAAPERGRAVSHEFRSEKWLEVYGKRVDEVIAALKAKRVPVIWVGLPPVRLPKMRADLAFINDLHKERAERAGIIYVDVWEGFLNENGEFSNFGPDVLGQVRRLRAGDGIHFTRQGARALAHFVDREIQRLLNRETPVALPAPEEPTGPAPAPAPGGPPPRPLAGPVVALTGGRPVSEALIGGRPQDARVTDPLAVRVLVRGEPPAPQPGRADSFVWPPAHTAAANDVAEPLSEPAVATIRGAAPSLRASPARPASRRPTQAATRPPARAVQ